MSTLALLLEGLREQAGLVTEAGRTEYAAVNAMVDAWRRVRHRPEEREKRRREIVAFLTKHKGAIAPIPFDIRSMLFKLHAPERAAEAAMKAARVQPTMPGPGEMARWIELARSSQPEYVPDHSDSRWARNFKERLRQLGAFM